MPKPMEKCYPSGQSPALVIVGYVLLGLGAILLFLCVPGWIRPALVGVGLIAAGLLLLRLGKAGR